MAIVTKARAKKIDLLMNVQDLDILGLKNQTKNEFSPMQGKYCIEQP